VSLTSSFVYLLKINSIINTSICENIITKADAITVSNKFLQKRYGGEIIWHSRDDKFYSRIDNAKEILLRNHNFDKEKKIIMFLGTPKPHKGIEDLINATAMLNDQNILLCTIGVDNSAYSLYVSERIKQLLPNSNITLGQQPFSKLSFFLSAADLITIPQRDNNATKGQSPAKLFDAMAMGKPIISTNASGISDIVKNNAWIVSPNNPKELAQAIRDAINSPEKACLYGKKVSNQYQNNFSFKDNQKRLLSIFKKYE